MRPAYMTFEEEELSALTADQCEELAAALTEDAASMPPGPRRDDLLKLAQNYRVLAAMKRLIAGKTN